MEEDTPTENTTSVTINETEEDEIDTSPAFIDMSSAVEVTVPESDDVEPMDDDDDDDDDDEAEVAKTTNQTNDSTEVEGEKKDSSKYTLTTHKDAIYAIASQYNPTTNSLSIVSGGGDDRAFLHNISSSSSPKSALLLHSHTDSVSAVAFNGMYVTAGKKGEERLVGVGSYDGAIVLYREENGEKVKVLEGPSDVECLCFHPKGGTVLLAGSIADGTVWMYHTPSSKCLQVFVGHEAGVTACSFTPDGKFALSASQDGTLRVWAPRTGLSRHVFRFNTGGEEVASLTCMGINGGSDGQLIICGSEDGTAYVCHVGGKKVVGTLKHSDAIASTSGGGGGGMDVDGEEGNNNDRSISVEAVAFAPAAINPNWCATGGMDGLLKIWDLTNCQCRQICRPPSSSDNDDDENNGSSSSSNAGITRLQWHPTLPLVFTSSPDGLVRLWDARDGSLVHTLYGHGDMINDMDIQFIGGTGGGTAVVVTGSDDKTVKVFEVDIDAVLAESQSKKAQA